MRKTSFIFAILILGLLALQNVHSEENRIKKYGDPSIRRYVLWRVYTLSTDSNYQMYVTVDSVLKEKFYAKEKFYISQYKKKYSNILNPNAYYIVLGTAGCSEESASVGQCFLAFQNNDYILPDTPENRKFLNQKWTETKVIYTDPEPMPRRKGRDID